MVKSVRFGVHGLFFCHFFLDKWVKVCYIQIMVRAIHFVGFKGEEFFSAVRVWGLPDFVHRWKDDRFKHGGEVHPNDLVIFANGEETKVRKYTFNDSEGL